mmetsp:Transcript_18207/g.48351  ORF Transcript_18207/g.48351 Transcript_18207/m.48351 type:complete len:269 (+) Transcript_18207:80-886(+)
MFSKTFLLLALAAVIAAQATCPCERSTGGTCSTISPDGPSTCTAGTIECNGCTCSSSGPLTCTVASASAFVFNGTGSFCEIETINVATCPEGPPSTPVNISSCCSETGVAASPTNECTLSSVPDMVGNQVPTVIYTVVSYNSNLSGVFNNQGTSINAYSASSTYDTIYGTGFPAGLPTLFFNNLDTTTTTDTTVLNPGQSVEYFQEFSGDQPNPVTYPAGTGNYNAIMAFNAPITFPYEITIFQSSTTGSTQTTRWTIDHCIYATVLQ